MSYKSFFRSIVFLGSFVLVLFLVGCSKKVNLSSYVDSDVLPNGFKKEDTFAIKGVCKKNLFNKEIERKIAFFLKNRGYKIVKSNEFHKYLIAFDCDVNKEAITEYVEKTVNSSSVNFWGTILNTNNGGNVSTTNKQMLPVEVAYYNKYVQLSVYEMDGSKNPEICTVQASIFDKDSDLRDYSNYLLAAALDYLGKNTYKQIKVKIGIDDKRIREVRDFNFITKKKKKK